MQLIVSPCAAAPGATISCNTNTLVSVTHPLGAVTANEYVPGAEAEVFGVTEKMLPIGSVHAYVTPGVALVALNTVDRSSQSRLLDDAATASGKSPSNVTVASAEEVQPFGAVTVRV